MLAVSVYNHYKRILSGKGSDVELQKSNVLLLGPSGAVSYTHLDVYKRQSLDSRSTYVGCIDERDILGRVLLCFMPFTDFGVVK